MGAFIYVFVHNLYLIIRQNNPTKQRSSNFLTRILRRFFIQNYDAAVGDITNRANRSLYVDFTSPYTESGVSMVVPIKAKRSRKSALVFLKPFTWELWVITCSFFFLIAIVVWVLEHRINEDFRGPPGRQVGTSVWFSFATMVFAQRKLLFVLNFFSYWVIAC